MWIHCVWDVSVGCRNTRRKRKSIENSKKEEERHKNVVHNNWLVQRGERHPSKSFRLSLLPSLFLSVSFPLLFLQPQANFLTLPPAAFFFFSDGQCLSNRSLWQSHGNRDGFSVARDLSMPNAYPLHSAGSVCFFICLFASHAGRRVAAWKRTYEFSRDISPTRGHFP